jgi:O-antigen ligase
VRGPASRGNPAFSGAEHGRPDASARRGYVHRIRRPDRSALVGSTIAVCCAVGVGLLTGVAPVVVTLALCCGGLLLLLLMLLRRGSPRIADALRGPQAAAELDAAPTGEPVELRVARALFYLGMLALGESAFRLPPGLTISEIAFILAFAFCALAILRGGPVSPVPVPMAIAVGVFALGGAISSVGAQSPSQSSAQVLHAIYVLLLWPWVGVMVIRNRQQLLATFGFWAASAAIDGVGALAQLAHVRLPGTVAEVGRYQGFTTHQNDLGGVAGIALVPGLIFATRGSRPPAFLRWLVVALVVAAVVLSGSVAGLAGAVLALLVWLSSPAVRSSSRVVVALAALCAVGVLAVASGRITSPAQRLTQVTSAGTGSAHDRLSVAEAAWKRIKHEPFVGTGLDTPDTAVVIISQGLSGPFQVHGLPIAAWYETGIFGFAGILGLVICLAVLAWRTVRRSRSPDQQVISWALLGAFVTFLVEVMTEPMVFETYDWIVAVVIVAWAATVASAQLGPEWTGVEPARLGARRVALAGRG